MKLNLWAVSGLIKVWCFGLKWVAGYENNYAKGLPYIYGVMIMVLIGPGAAAEFLKRFFS